MWATSNQLGCGATQCDSVAGLPNNSSAIVLVCNYGPSWVKCLLKLFSQCLFDSGNLEGERPYLTGNLSCSNCPDDKPSCVSNLCTTGEWYTDYTTVKSEKMCK